MKKIGITGSIGSGKSTVCSIFEDLGVPVYYSDTKAKELMHTNKILVKAIKNLFGDEIYDLNEKLNRPKLANIVFNDKDKLEKLNCLVHPVVKNDFDNWCKKHEKKSFIIQESALLFESGIYQDFDKIITVTSDKKLRINRVIKRDKINKKEVEARINNQLDDNFKIKRSHFVIHNNSDFESLKKEVENVFIRLC